MNRQIIALSSIIFLTFLFSSTVFVNASQTSQTFTVPPGSTKTVNVNLSKGDVVNGTFSASGGSGTGVNFMVTDPNGKHLTSYNYTSYANFSFSASVTGTYLFTFDNSFCTCEGGKNVTLDYAVIEVSSTPVPLSSQGESNIGFPILITLIAVIVITTGVAAVIKIRRRKTNSNNETISP